MSRRFRVSNPAQVLNPARVFGPRPGPRPGRVSRPRRVSDRDVQERALEWIRAVLEDRRFPVKELQRLLAARAYSTAKQMWNGNARFSAGDIATLAQYEGFGPEFALHVMGAQRPEPEEKVRARMAWHLDEMERLLRGEAEDDDGGRTDRCRCGAGLRSGGVGRIPPRDEDLEKQGRT